MMSLSDDKQADVIDAFNTTSRYLDDILNILGQVCYLIVSIPDLCTLTYFASMLGILVWV